MPIFYPILRTITMRRDAAGFQRDHLNLILVENKKAFLHNRQLIFYLHVLLIYFFLSNLFMYKIFL